ncbi:polysaccharide pyruvyl transferase family protein [Vibrio sp. 10N.222.54.A3]|uniref:polysaccharide pyruvyl transferase family protein n=1 Tax=Vibrio sp. 10N.222.54.A3 TaxID=3229633 RepID=UPI00354F79A7
MLIEIHGAGFKNKGAELMLIATMEKIRQDIPNAEFCINPSVYDDKPGCEKYGIYEFVKAPEPRGGRLFSPRFDLNKLLSVFFNKDKLKRKGYVRYQDVDALVDVSGVRFGDKAPIISGHNFLKLAKYYRNRGKPVFLLPQMFGPFDTELQRKIVGELECLGVNFIARDNESFKYLDKLVTNKLLISEAPDITIALRGKSNNATLPTEDYGCIVPNVRMLDRGDDRWKIIYQSRLLMAAEEMLKVGITPSIILHSVDGSEDLPFAKEIESRLKDKCIIKHGDDPLELKEYISKSKLLVGSRYHSIVSALSSGVPTVVMGWAHKYDTILDDFGVPHLIHRANDTEKDYKILLDEVLKVESRNDLIKVISQRRDELSSKSDLMWKKVTNCFKE